MKELKKIRLINWHMFHDRCIEVNGNILLTGENGTGKSTLLDALQYVLCAGKAKFNIAANEGAKRKIEGYIRGKLGVEGQEYLRNGDVTSHIALEFYDHEEKEFFVIGVVLDLPKSGYLKKHFYVLENTSIIDSLYINNRQPKSWIQFQSALKTKKIKVEYSEQQTESSKIIRQALGLGTKYNDLLPKALAFKPIDSLNKFMFDYLLNKNEINLDSLTDNIRRYREFEKIIENQKQAFTYLQKINDQKEKIDSLEIKIKIQELVNEFILYYEFEDTFQNKKNRHEQLVYSIKNLEKEYIHSKNEYDRIEKEYIQLSHALENNDGYRMQKELTNKHTELKASYKIKENEFSHLYKDITNEVRYFDQLRYTHNLPTSKDEILEDDHLINKLNEISNYIEERKSSLNINIYRNNQLIEEKNIKKKEIEEQLKALKNKRFSYRKEVNDLIQILKDKLYTTYGKQIEVRPFCEYLEINDETWRNAIEGYLNNQRFDLIVEPKYFQSTLEIYEQYKDKNGIYGVGIVDVSKLEMYEEIWENTLASKVDAQNPYARVYANYLLNRVNLVNKVTELRDYDIAITPSCMLYKNFTVRAIHPNIYSRPFIGQKAIEVQLENCEKEYQQINSEIIKATKSKNENQRLLEIANKSKIKLLSETSLNIIQNYKSLNQQLKDVDRDLKEIKKDSSWMTLESQLNQKAIQKAQAYEVNQRIHSLYDASIKENDNIEIELKGLNDKIDKIRNAKEESDEKNIEILNDTNQMYFELNKKFNHDFEKMKRINSDRILNSAKELQIEEIELKKYMHDYNQFTNIGFGETKDDLPKYMAKYEKLRNIELDETIRKSENARKKCQDSFQEDFISKLNSLFETTKKEIKKLNQTLSQRLFNGERYEFIIKPSDNQIYKQYYDIITSGEDFSRNSLFVDELSDKNRQIMLELFERLAAVDNDSKNEKLIQEYTDYRRYMSYDIKIHHADGNYSFFSKVNTEKSGGETQTPYYVTIAASFEQLLSLNRQQTSCGCLVLFDEAFNNMDESRIENMMKFYSDLNIQLIIAVPPGRIQTITPYVETVLTLIKQNNQIYIGDFKHEL